MISYECDLKVSAQQLFDFLVNQSAGEIEVRTGKKPSPKDLALGFRYHYRKKVRGLNAAVSAEVKAEEPHHLHSSYNDGMVKADMDYAITAVDDSHCHVVFSQTSDSEAKDGFSKMLFHSQMKKQFRRVEKYILKQEKESVK